MNQSETTRILKLLTQLTEAVIGTEPSRTRTGHGASLSERVDNLDTKVTTLDKQLSRVDKRLGRVDARFKEIDKRFDQIDRSIESTRVQVVDLVTRVHDELTGRIIDLEIPVPGGKGGGGRGSGGGGVPLAS